MFKRFIVEVKEGTKIESRKARLVVVAAILVEVNTDVRAIAGSLVVSW